MKKNLSLSSVGDSSIFDRQGKGCPDVNEKTVKIPKRYRDDIKHLQKVYNLYEGLVIDIPLIVLGKICERDYSKVEAYRGLKRFLLESYGITLSIYSRKMKQMSGNEFNNKTEK